MTDDRNYLTETQSEILAPRLAAPDALHALFAAEDRLHDLHQVEAACSRLLAFVARHELPTPLAPVEIDVLRVCVEHSSYYEKVLWANDGVAGDRDVRRVAHDGLLLAEYLSELTGREVRFPLC